MKEPRNNGSGGNLKERKLKWCGHAVRREEHFLWKWTYNGGSEEGLREDAWTE